MYKLTSSCLQEASKGVTMRDIAKNCLVSKMACPVGLISHTTPPPPPNHLEKSKNMSQEKIKEGI